MSFHYGIISYDFHSYLKLDDPLQVEFARTFKESFEKEFKDELTTGQCRLFKTWLEPIGPHPDGYGMFESDTTSPETFLKLLNFYQMNHGPLNVLVHPRSNRGELNDHTIHAFWIGEKLPLKEGTLSNNE